MDKHEHHFATVGKVISILIGAAYGGVTWSTVENTAILTGIGTFIGGVGGFMINKLMTYLWKKYVSGKP